jgi:hypothetical protein
MSDPLMFRGKPQPFTMTPAPGVPPEAFEAEILRRKRSRGKCKEPTARWIKPHPSKPGCVTCPTCREPVTLAAWWSHGCKDPGRYVCDPEWDGESRPREKRQPVKVWSGTIPNVCDHCHAPIVNGFSDSPVEGSRWGHLCGMCWNLTVAPVLGQWYERKGKRWVQVESRP